MDVCFQGHLLAHRARTFWKLLFAEYSISTSFPSKASLEQTKPNPNSISRATTNNLSSDCSAGFQSAHSAECALAVKVTVIKMHVDHLLRVPKATALAICRQMDSHLCYTSTVPVPPLILVESFPGLPWSNEDQTLVMKGDRAGVLFIKPPTLCLPANHTPAK